MGNVTLGVINTTDEAIDKAVKLLGDKYFVPADAIEDREVEVIATAAERGTAPDRFLLDPADFFAILEGRRSCSPKEKTACLQILRKTLDLPEKDPDGVSLSFRTVELDRGENDTFRGQIAITTITPRWQGQITRRLN